MSQPAPSPIFKMDSQPNYPFATVQRIPEDEDEDYMPMMFNRDPLLSDGAVLSTSFEHLAALPPRRPDRSTDNRPRSPPRPTAVRIAVSQARSSSSSTAPRVTFASDARPARQDAPRYSNVRFSPPTSTVWDSPPSYESVRRSRFRRILPRPPEEPPTAPSVPGASQEVSNGFSESCMSCQASFISLADTLDDVSGHRARSTRDRIDARTWARLLNSTRSLRLLSAGVKKKVDDLELIIRRYLSVEGQDVPLQPFTLLTNDDINSLSAREAQRLIMEHESLLLELPLAALHEIVRELRHGFRRTDAHNHSS